MSKKEKYPITAALRALRALNASFEVHLYRYEAHSGAGGAAEALELDEHHVVKTLIMEDELAQPLVILMHGDCRVSTGELARQLGVKKVAACDPEVAQKHSGYLVGGTSPYGTKRQMPIYAERSILDLERLWLNGGKRGMMVSLTPQELERTLQPTWVEVALLKTEDGLVKP